MDKSLKEILLANGSGTSDVAVKRELVKRILYKVTDLLATGTKLIPVNSYDVLDIKTTFPDEGIVAEHPIPEGSTSNETVLGWTDYGYSLEKGQARFTLTDESVIRGIDQQQSRRSFQRGAESMAKKKDENIISKLYAGAGQSQTIANPWDTAGGTAAVDINGAWGKLLANSNISDPEMTRVWIVAPAIGFAKLNELQEINNLNQTLKDWLEGSFGFHIVGTRSTSLGKNALMLVNSEETGEHGYLRNAKTPLSESERVLGVGEKYVITQYFNTKVTPESDSVATNDRIVKMDSVIA
jgi:hypothetical protein